MRKDKYKRKIYVLVKKKNVARSIKFRQYGGRDLEEYQNENTMIFVFTKSEWNDFDKKLTKFIKKEDNVSYDGKLYTLYEMKGSSINSEEYNKMKVNYKHIVPKGYNYVMFPKDDDEKGTGEQPLNNEVKNTQNVSAALGPSVAIPSLGNEVKKTENVSVASPSPSLNDDDSVLIGIETKQQGGIRKKIIFDKDNKCRKHKGIVQSGGNKGKLKKGFRYTGKKTKTGLSMIKKC